jgi:hypothetical protein
MDTEPRTGELSGELSGEPGDLGELLQLGEVFDDASAILDGRTPGVFLAETLLQVRSRNRRYVALIPNRVQQEYERQRGQRNIVLKARQLGISTWIAGRFFLKTITHPGTLTVQVAHTQEAAEEIFGIVHRFLQRLPAELRRQVLKTSRASARQIVFPALDSEYRVETAGDGNAGRGMTIQNLHCSEVARWPGNAAETMAGLRAALAPDGELVLESTPNGAGGCFYDEWRHAGEDGSDMVRHFFPWWWEPHYVTVAVTDYELTAEERQLMDNFGLSREQIGYRRRLKASFRGLAKQEYAENAEDCFLASGDCVFDVEAIERRLREISEPVESRMAGRLQIWYPAVKERHYLVAVDPAGGGSEGDWSVIEVMELKTGLQCAEVQAKLPTLELAQLVAALGREYNGALLVVERNNHGSGVLAYLKSVCRYEPVYAQRGQEGWLTSSLSRPEMLGKLGTALVETPEIFKSRRLLLECRSFVRQASGGTGAKFGEHDDCVMAMAMALSVREEKLLGSRA